MENVIRGLEVYFDEHKNNLFGYHVYLDLLEDEKIKKCLDNMFYKVKKVNEDDIFKISRNSHVRNLVEAYLNMKDIPISDGNDSKVSSPLNDYYNSIKGYKVLTREEEEYYFKEYKKGSKEAFNMIYLHNLRLAYRNVLILLKDSFYTDEDKMDAIQEANISIIRAIEKFDVERGNKFSTYLWHWIRQAVGRYKFDHTRTIRLPVHVNEVLFKMRTYSMNHLDEYGKPLDFTSMDPEELAKMFETGVGTIKLIQKLPTADVSLNKRITVDGDSESELQDFIPASDKSAEDESIETIFSEEFMQAFENSNLSDEEKEVLIRRFGLYDNIKETLESIGKSRGVTRERVRQVEKKALEKLKKNEDFIDFYGKKQKLEPGRRYY